jgi:hypothetical protein
MDQSGEFAARWDKVWQEMQDQYMREFGLGEVDARGFANLVLDLEMGFIDDRVMAQAWDLVRKDWTQGERTVERLATLLIHHVGMVNANSPHRRSTINFKSFADRYLPWECPRAFKDWKKRYR